MRAVAAPRAVPRAPGGARAGPQGPTPRQGSCWPTQATSARPAIEDEAVQAERGLGRSPRDPGCGPCVAERAVPRAPGGVGAGPHGRFAAPAPARVGRERGGQLWACRISFRPPHTALFGRASTAPVTEFRRNRMLDAPDSSRALTICPSGIVTRVPAVTYRPASTTHSSPSAIPTPASAPDQAPLADRRCGRCRRRTACPWWTRRRRCRSRRR